ncbi:outer membrane beta-barrel protein [Candidatus Palauibacter soopunensis]|uniref:outer membrane beta-barrel protein n=1 Tax=Candidatus Palauibacter soopunensis TaxID=3056739 RepID=UPI0023824FB5|nr:outer membrane beta-barrel protein [Candidatus Palauibacter soopunensis]MDE2878393.1 outer membrane beta-barrel protein [Candidatus Palauibacter soopunensis]
MGIKRNAGRWGAGLALGLVCALPPAAEAQIGILAGYNRDTLAEFLPENGFDLTDLTDGYHVGVFLNLNLATFSVRPALIYHRMPELVAMAGDERVQFDIDMVEIPLDFRVRLPLPAVQPYVLGGPVLTFPSSTFSGVDDLLTARPVRAEFGVGVELDLGFRLWPEVRYGFGISSLMGSDVAVGSRVLQGDGEPRHDTLTLRLGISF